MMAPLRVDVPPDFRTALDEAGVSERFDALPYSHRKQHVLAIEDAKTEATRARRIAKAIEMLRR